MTINTFCILEYNIRQGTNALGYKLMFVVIVKYRFTFLSTENSLSAVHLKASIYKKTAHIVACLKLHSMPC